MKYSQLIGIIFCIAMTGVCFLPWTYIPNINVTLSGVNGYINEHLTFGRQIITHSFFAALLIIFFCIPKIWAKRTNIFFAAMNLALAIKNFILFSFCREGICPEKKLGIYLLIFTASTIQLMTLFPKMKIVDKK